MRKTLTSSLMFSFLTVACLPLLVIGYLCVNIFSSHLQREIRDKLKEQHRDEKIKKYLEQLKRDTYVWNFFDENGGTGPNPIATGPDDPRR